MNVDVTMPQLGETVAEGTITRWLRAVGDVITAQEPLLEITTDKVDTEVPAPAAGRLARIVVPEDETVPVGAVLAVIAVDQAVDQVLDAPAPAVPPRPAGPEAGAMPAHRPPRHTHSPRVRRLAAETGIALEGVAGSGPRGRVTPQDVALASRRDDTAPAPAPGTALAGPRSTTVVEVDVTALVRAEAPLLAHVARAALDALRDVPGIAASRDLGFLDADGPEERVRVVNDAADLNVTALARRLGPDPGDPATGPPPFVLAHSGRHGALFGTPLVASANTPVLDVGALVERPAVLRRPGEEPAIAIRSFVHLSFGYDARRITTREAARFLDRVEQRLGGRAGEGEGVHGTA